MRSRSGARSTVSTVLSIALLMAIAAFAILIGLQVRGDHPARFDVAGPKAWSARWAKARPACFSFGVTNLGRPAVPRGVHRDGADRAWPAS